MMSRILVSVSILALSLAPNAEARPPRRDGFVPYSYQPANPPQSQVYQSYYYAPSAMQESATPATSSLGVAAAETSRLGDGATEALDEVNARRAAKGLYPYVRDDNLTRGAANVAAFRAQRHMAGHTSNDFGGLPAGVAATASGCAAWEPSWGWGSCCTDDVGPRYAGAAWVLGSDGRRYMHLFVR
jgi:uncharacterized protein YkwD